jgi:hypothetical protein
LDPSQVTGPPEEAGAFDAEEYAAALESAADLAAEEPEAFEEPAEEPVPEPAEGAPEAGFVVVADGAVVEVVPAAPSSWVPVPSLHAVRARAARTAVAAAAARRVREVRRLDMWSCPFGVRVAVVIG